MKLLGFDLSTRRGSIALVNGGQILCARDWPNDRRNSAPFFAALDGIIREHGAPEAIVVGLGPGSYTGTRIAISAAIGLQATTGAALTGLSSLSGISEENEYIVIGDAKRASFFFATISGGLFATEPDLLSQNEMNERISSITTIPIYTSDELPQFTEVRAAFSFGQIALSARAKIPAESCSRAARSDLPSRAPHHYPRPAQIR
jgi:tRNA threonylcarbamoyl adenosine modification protein YeaZ